MTQNNMMMEELTVSIYSQQFEDLTFQNFSGVLCRRTSLKPLCHFNISYLVPALEVCKPPPPPPPPPPTHTHTPRKILATGLLRVPVLPMPARKIHHSLARAKSQQCISIKYVSPRTTDQAELPPLALHPST